jgi:carbon-monoxide dehydrogenase medium subunit
VIRPFEYGRPANLDEALELLSEHGEDSRPIAGGTALVILMKQRLVRPSLLVSLDRLQELRGIEPIDGGLHIGAMTTQREAETSPLVRARAPLLAETLRHVATIRIRNVATLGGNLAHADPAQDPPVSLIALGARVRLAAKDGDRELPIEDFYSDYYETVLEPGELVREIYVPPLPPRTGTAFCKFLPRSADDYATVAVAAAVTVDEEGRCDHARVALGAVATTPLRAQGAEDVLLRRAPTSDVLREAAAAVRSDVDPLHDARGSAAYKRDMAEVFVRRALKLAFSDPELAEEG